MTTYWVAYFNEPKEFILACGTVQEAIAKLRMKFGTNVICVNDIDSTKYKMYIYRTIVSITDDTTETKSSEIIIEERVL